MSSVGSDTIPAPAALCDAYEACVADSTGGTVVTDPWSCANAAASPAHTFNLPVYIAEHEVCPGQMISIPLPASGATSCYWGLLGGSTQAHYDVSLVANAASAGGGHSIVCQTCLNPYHAHDWVAQPDDIPLAYSSGSMSTTELTYVRLHLDPTFVPLASCPPAATMCSWIP